MSRKEVYHTKELDFVLCVSLRALRREVKSLDSWFIRITLTVIQKTGSSGADLSTNLSKETRPTEICFKPSLD